ncbi:unnamed protein product, partial [Musa banksii]
KCITIYASICLYKKQASEADRPSAGTTSISSLRSKGRSYSAATQASCGASPVVDQQKLSREHNSSLRMAFNTSPFFGTLRRMVAVASGNAISL